MRNPDAIAREIEEQQRGSGPSGQPPQLTPGAKRALLDAHRISHSLGSTYIGPEHILFALAVNPESNAGGMLAAARVTPEALQQAYLAGPRAARLARTAGPPRRLRWTSSAVT